MSKTYVPGPCLIYAGVGASAAFLLLGLTESSVRISQSARFRPVQADYGGDMDADVQMMGEEIMISMRLVRYNEVTLELCKKRLGSALATVPGTGLSGAIGALMGLEQNTFPLAVVAQYASKTVFSDMVAGYHIPRAYLADSTEVELGSAVKVPQVMFRGIAQFDLAGGYSLYDSNVAALTLPDPS